MTLSSHVLDGARGVPATGVSVRWERRDGEAWHRVAEAVTGDDGRVTDWGGDRPLDPGTHRLVFGSGDYFSARGVDTFYPEVVVVFAVADGARHHHVPLLLSPFSYSTYRGS
ncbi:MAG TPA: hydroxyisourate hydrolase [Nocardioidaceae bacterium]|nr:hydroxyisourate hydrolase [Nocardioidaceae bacterium]